ncbi:hypothetical protein C7S16_3784 [Burkholderia thailandensis]|uniref:Secreted protein n=1 Tax=Burkholderia thailandensis TaxID=57975 RepID=A0AAW9CWH2_BURTH|nr:hypothetical protein [Burkholderia thailandensis]
MKLLRQHLAAQALVQALHRGRLLALAHGGRLSYAWRSRSSAIRPFFSMARRKRRIATSNGSFLSKESSSCRS